MSSASIQPLTELLQRARAGDGDACREAVNRAYAELRRRAEKLLAREGAGHTLQPTALVHEAWLKLWDAEGGLKVPELQNRTQFFQIVVRTMRQILVDFARHRHADKRGGGQPLLSLDDADAVFAEPDRQILAIDEALPRLHELRPRAAQVVELRFFGGCTIPETAAALGVSPETVKGDWKFARAWLRRELEQYG